MNRRDLLELVENEEDFNERCLHDLDCVTPQDFVEAVEEGYLDTVKFPSNGFREFDGTQPPIVSRCGLID